MAFLSTLLTCCLPTKSIKEAKETPHYPSAPVSHSNTDANQVQAPEDNHVPEQDGYTSTPLPAYTPCSGSGIAVQEKTLTAHLRDPPISNESYHHHLQNYHQTTETTDEKQRLAWEEAAAAGPYNNANYPYYPYPTHPRPEEASSDVSSAISFPSSYGNTSTATRETPPPPYSPRAFSPAPSRRSMSISSAFRRQHQQAQMQLPMAAITQPPAVFQPGRPPRWSANLDDPACLGLLPIIQDNERGSSATLMPSTPPARPARYSWESDPR
ncbi:uncharacterized protein DSM5745_05519 [Aspergillus mulundensis]|uniref:Uncharacterized protein n=1 Tax=Aspergillus mulundensis TaxID=1810919 RepID=A0A3D8RX77_9EURO|nr:Uncharacterized protein DSM5745_05519 [Aspergillus mulundensis]RDW78667.1 Uncharacterized protein DSM5745_05519 [Aspergillus mulundensis]